MNPGNLYFKTASSIPIPCNNKEQLLSCLSKILSPMQLSVSVPSLDWWMKSKVKESEIVFHCYICMENKWIRNFQLSNTWFMGKVKANVCISETSSVSHAYKNFLSIFHQLAQYRARIAWICHSDASKVTARNENFWTKITRNSYNKLSATRHWKSSIFRKRYNFLSHISSGGSIS